MSETLVAGAPITRRAVIGSVLGTGVCAVAGKALGGSAGVAVADEALTSDGLRIYDASAVSWDKEADFVTVGSGTASFGAISAARAGREVVVIESRGLIGGTTRLSGCCCWVPLNKHQEQEGYGQDLGRDEVVSYLKAIDVCSGSTDEAKSDYVDNAAAAFERVESDWGFKQAVYSVLGDYQDCSGCKALGRSLMFVDDDGNSLFNEDFFAQKVEPAFGELGIDVMLNTSACGLVTDGGAVVGVVAADADGKTLAVKANQGVLIGAGGFERNKEMRQRYLRGPIFGSNSVETCKGDGIVLGMMTGARVANMASVWQLPFYLTGEDEDLSMATDWFEYGGLPGSLTVNSKGRRFCDENTAYGAADLAFYAYDTHTFAFENIPAYQICDADHVANYGWPAYLQEQPEWLEEYQSIEELAEACGIDSQGLADELERFNGFCETGVDEDFHRGEGNYGPIDVAGYGVDRPELANPCMAPVKTPPFYVAKIVPGCCGGTCGGLDVNLDAQVLDLSGNPITGLYACGNSSASPFGSAYPGAGGTDGAGFYRALRAANHACDLGEF